MDINKYKVLSNEEEKNVKGGEILIGSAMMLAWMLGTAAAASQYKRP
ncbi:hypothetical protein HRH62_14130 [Enterococcus faecalis]|nr:hypothetical protein [Enterococcus faecalis]NSV82888.1 hypothetical protein [Enterococcus faecalis]NSW20821.1 hypothetical protein [Enterococcus faecalis]HDT8155477.1 hypothetical protein [Enterococcus faecalis]